ncbi:hypothetical protein TNCV_3791792 [Trichonephila clavipes]|nr:hypothetical protein TNCV_3791792 [Trichonephila clavipes]
MLRDVICLYSVPNYHAIFQVRAVILQRASISGVWYFLEDTILIPGVTPKHRTHVPLDLNQGNTLVSPFWRYPSFLEALQQQRSCVDVYRLPQKYYVDQWHLRTDAGAISEKGTTVEYMELHSSIQQNVSPHEYSRTTSTVSFLNVCEVTSCLLKICMTFRRKKGFYYEYLTKN